MHSPRPTYMVLILFLILFSSCRQDEKRDISAAKKIASAEVLEKYNEAKNAKGTPGKIKLFNAALAAVKDHRDTLLPNILNNKIYYHNTLREYDTSSFYADSLIALSALKRDTANLATGYYRKARIFNYRGNLEEVFSNSFESRRYYTALGDRSQAGMRTLEMALAQIEAGDHLGSQETATNALNFLNRNKDSVYISSVYNIIAQVYHNRFLYDDAIKEYQNALDFTVQKKDSLSVLNNLALVYRDKKEFDTAFSIWEDLLNRADDDYKKARYRDNLAYAAWLENPNVGAENQMLLAMDLREEVKDEVGLLASYSHLADFYKDRDLQLHRKYAQDLLQLAQKHGNPESEFEALEKLIQVSPLQETRILSERYRFLNDSLQTAALNARNFFAKIKYDEEQKQQKIVGLEVQNVNQKLEAQRVQARTITGALIGLVLLLALSFLIYYLRVRHKKEKIREVHKAESRISKVIHDELANDIFNVMSSIEPIAPAHVIDKLERIYMNTRDISRENMEVSTGPGYIDQLFSTLSSITPTHTKLIMRGEKSVKWEKIGEEKKIVIYRVLQELMINMRKHSGAGLVAITFEERAKKLAINYTDNGCGMYLQTSNTGNGLRNLKNRIDSLDGSVDFESEEGKGLTVKLQIPL